MITYKTVNIILVFVSLLVLIFYDDTQERETREKSLYIILYILYLTHVCGLIFNVNFMLHFIIIFLVIITGTTYLLSTKQTSLITDMSISINEQISNIFKKKTSLSIKKLNRLQKFDIPNTNRHVTVSFMIYLDVINRIENKKLNLLSVNNCPIIQYNSSQNTYDIVQYDCDNEPRYSVPIKYTKWTKFHIEFVKSDENNPLYLGLKIDDELVYKNKIYNISEYDQITIGYNSFSNDSSIGFVKSILIGGT